MDAGRTALAAPEGRASPTRPGAPRLARLALWIAPLAFLGVFFFYPLGAVLRIGLIGLSAANWVKALRETIPRPLWFTFWQASLSTLLTLLVGLPGAYVFAHYEFPGKTLLKALTTIPFILPAVVVAAAFNALLGPRGWVNFALMSILGLAVPPLVLVNTLWAILLAHVFYNTTVVLRIVGNHWAHLDPRWNQAARVLGAGRTRAFLEVTLPLLWPALLAAALLVFLFDFTSFGVILILGGPQFSTLEVQIYVEALQLLNLPVASLVCLVQLLCTLILTGAYARMTSRTQVASRPRSQSQVRIRPQGVLQRGIVAAVVIGLSLLLVSPLAALGLGSVTRLEANRAQQGEVRYGLTLDFYRELFQNARQSLFYVPPIDAARNSILYGMATVVISLSLGFLAATALSRPGRGNSALDSLLMLPLGSSAVTLGLGLIVTFHRPPVDLHASPLLLPIAHSLVAFPFVVRSLVPALATIPKRLREAAAMLGASPGRAWREVDLPIVARAAAVAATFAFAASMGEFGATSLLARPEYPTLPIAIYRFLSLPGALNYSQALAMATLLMLVTGLGILLIERLRLPGVGEF